MSRGKRKSATLRSLNRLRQLQEERARLDATRAQADRTRAATALEDEQSEEQRLLAGVAKRRADSRLLAVDRHEQELAMLMRARDRVERRKSDFEGARAKQIDCTEAYAGSWRRRQAAARRLERGHAEQRREDDKRSVEAMTEMWLSRRRGND